jgi:hypothetical protein
MTSRRIRDFRQFLVDEAAPFGATVRRIEVTHGGHLRGVISAGGHEVSIIASLSPSCWRAGRKVRANARRALRSLPT